LHRRARVKIHHGLMWEGWALLRSVAQTRLSSSINEPAFPSRPVSSASGPLIREDPRMRHRTANLVLAQTPIKFCALVFIRPGRILASVTARAAPDRRRVSARFLKLSVHRVTQRGSGRRARTSPSPNCRPKLAMQAQGSEMGMGFRGLGREAFGRYLARRHALLACTVFPWWAAATRAPAGRQPIPQSACRRRKVEIDQDSDLMSGAREFAVDSPDMVKLPLTAPSPSPCPLSGSDAPIDAPYSRRFREMKL
jgi:hypothetical protein